MEKKSRIRLTINGKELELEAEPNRSLLEVLRDDLGLTGTKQGCDREECGTCTVLLDGVSALSCNLAVGMVVGRKVETIEGLGQGGGLHPLQKAFVEKGAVQCGFCTPGIILETEALLRRDPAPTSEKITERLFPHLCRCTGYAKILEAIEYGARLRRGEPAVVTASDQGYVGRPRPALDAEDKVTGRAKFAADLYMPDMAYAKILRSPHAHAIIRNIDTSEAERIPGVRGFVTGRNLRAVRLGVKPLLRPGRGTFQPVIAIDRVRYKGEPVAAVAADTREIAEQALAAVKVDYEVLESVIGVEAALKPDAPRIFPEGNVEQTQTITRGDIAKGFAEADVVVENWYYTPFQEHGYIEPEAGLAYVDTDGRLFLQACTQFPYQCQQSLAQLLGLKAEEVRVVATPVGGGFGGKYVEHAWILAALLAYEVRRPVKVVYTREESILSSTKRHAALMRFKTGASRNGRLVALEAELFMDVGAYFDPLVTRYTAVAAQGPYEIPNVLVKAAQVTTNVQKSGAFRGLGGIQIAFAQEQQLELIAQQLQMDPWEIRYLNALRPGSVTATGHHLEEGVGISATLKAVRPYYEQALQVARAENGSRETASTWKRGVGLACGWRAYGGQSTDPTEATVELLPEGTLEVRSGLVELGVGSTTALAQMAADLMGVRLEDVHLIGGDTARAPFPYTTSGEKAVMMIGGAVCRALEELRAALTSVSAQALGCRPEEITFKGGNALQAGRKLPLDRLAALCREVGVPLKYQGAARWPGYRPLDPDTGQGVFCDLYAMRTQVAEVDVNTTTGEVKVLRVVDASDTGTVVNPILLEGQIHGSIVQGLGYALTEEFVPGQTATLREYGLPTVLEMPEMVVLFVGDKVPSTPFGAKGAGETAIVPTPAAIANAIAHATRARLRRLPAKPDRVLAALTEN